MALGFAYPELSRTDMALTNPSMNPSLTWHWALQTLSQLITWTGPYTGALLLLRLLAGRTWYGDVDGFGPQLPRLNPWKGALLWPAFLSLSEGILWRGFCLAIIINIVGGAPFLLLVRK